MNRILILVLLLPAIAWGQTTSTAQTTQVDNTIRGKIYNPASAADMFQAIINSRADGTASGTNTYSVLTNGARFTAYSQVNTLRITFTNANTSATCSLNANAIGVLSIKGNDGNDLAVGALKAGGTYDLRYTGTNLRVMNDGSGGAFTTIASDATTARTLVTGDNLKKINFSNSGAITITLNSSAAVGTAVWIWKEAGSGNITLTTSGTTLKAPDNQLLTDETGAVVVYEGSNVWSASGNLGASGGGGTGTVTDVSVVTANGISGSVATSTTTPAITLTLGAITPTSVNSVVVSGSSTPTIAVTGTTTISGTHSGSSSGTNTGDQTSVTGNSGTATALATSRTIGILTGDATSAGSLFNGTANNTNAITFATVNSNVGTFGSATQVAQIVTNAKGLTTAVSNVTITPAASSVVNTPSGNLSAVNGQAAFDELDAEKLAVANNLSDVASAPATLQNIHALDSRIEIVTDGGNRTLTTADFPAANGGQVIELQLTSASPQTITVPTDAAQAITTGEYIQMRATGAGGYVLSPSGGVSITSTTGSLAGPAQGFIAFLKKEGTNTWRLDNGVPNGSAYQVWRMNSAGTSPGYGSIDLSQSAVVGSSILGTDHGGTGSATPNFWPITGSRALTGDVTMSGAFSVGLGVTPASKFHIQALSNGTASAFRIQNSTPTVLFDMTESGVTTQTASASGASVIGFSQTPTLTYTANSQTQYGFDLNVITVDGAFTGGTRSYGRYRLNSSSTPAYDFGVATFISNGITLWDFKTAGDQTLRNSTGPLYLRGGSGSSTALKLGAALTTSVDGSIGIDFTSTLFGIGSGSGLTRTFTGFKESWVITSANANTITLIGRDYDPNISSIGGSTLNHYAQLWRSGNVGIADNTPSEKLSVAGNIKTRHLIGQSTAPGVAGGAGAGTGPTVTLSNATDISGLINLTTGTTPSTGATVLTVTFNAAYGSAPNVVLFPANANAATLSGITMVYATSTTTTFVVTSGTTGLTGATDYKWFYQIIQ